MNLLNTNFDYPYMRLSKSIVGQQEADAVSRILLEDGYLGMGAEVGRFEEDIANYLNIDKNNVVCVNSGTAALHLSVEALLSSGDEILVPSFTFLSSFQAISASGIIPVACDIDENSLTIDINDAEKRITDQTKAIMPVHYASNPANIEQLYLLAEKYGLRIIEDAAHAFGCSYKGRKIGSFGDIICFSFDGIKNITSGEGGAIISWDNNFINTVKDTRLLGIEKDSDKRYIGARSWDFDVSRQGYRYHMSNIFAAIGRIQLTRLDNEFAPKRKKLMRLYRYLLENNHTIKLQMLDENSNIIPHIFPIRILNEKRNELKEFLENSGIPTGIHYKPNHLLSYYGAGEQSLETTEMVYKQILTLPLHPEITEEDIQNICLLINQFTQKS